MGKWKVVYTYSEEKGERAVIAQGVEFHAARWKEMGWMEMDGGNGYIRM